MFGVCLWKGGNVVITLFLWNMCTVRGCSSARCVKILLSFFIWVHHVSIRYIWIKMTFLLIEMVTNVSEVNQIQLPVQEDFGEKLQQVRAASKACF